MIKLAVGYPWTSDFIYTDFVQATLNMIHPPGYEVRYIRGTGVSSPRRHNDICEQSLEWGADLICIIGADQVHPKDMLIKLTKHIENGCDMVGALIPFRGYVDWQFIKPFQAIAWRLECDGVRDFLGWRGSADMMIPITPEGGDLQRAHIIGSGVLMFKTEHLIALERPWFFEHLDEKSQHRVADMDTRFVWRMQEEAQADLWVDTTIKVQHLHVFKIDDTFQNRFDDWMDPDKADHTICKFSKTNRPKSDEYWEAVFENLKKKQREKIIAELKHINEKKK